MPNVKRGTVFSNVTDGIKANRGAVEWKVSKEGTVMTSQYSPHISLGIHFLLMYRSRKTDALWLSVSFVTSAIAQVRLLPNPALLRIRAGDLKLTRFTFSF